MLDGEHRRDVEGFGHDGGVRGAAARLGGEPGDVGMAQVGDVGGRQFLRHHDHLLMQPVHGGMLDGLEGRKDVFGHVLQVGDALPQIGLLGAFDLVRHRGDGLLDRPFRVHPPALDGVGNGGGEHFIADHQKVGVEDGGDVGVEEVFGLVLELADLLFGL